MARTVDPQRHEARRLQIIDAALTVFAARGYAEATTARICRQAGIGSGTFFHYFPTKLSVLLAILTLGTAEAGELAGRLEGRTDALAVVHEIIDHALADAADPRLAGFVRAVGGVLAEPPVAQALADDDDAQHSLIRTWVARAQEAGQVREDMRPERLSSWVQVLLGGFLDRAAVDPRFTGAAEGGVLHDTVDRFLRG
ncbi:TetR/AcrR family transcriptional regulator [Georgenia sunbinii]|uniref:TetR/AcrR family transcriptional regulator n=1 Tax=Georgenia sunbinii TaxID=3117728 RepID=UPI002F267795